MDNLKIIKVYQDAIWSEKNINAIDTYFDKNAMIHSPMESTKGTEKMKSIISEWHQGFPNLEVFWDDFICEGNKVATRWHAQGKHEDKFLNIPASHKTIHYSGATMYQLSEQKISQYWAFVDMQHILKQIQ